ncbi:hypothetical protein P879_11926 [Paragonimus westermani]|uniref:Deacetylase sirtuin-type domain-containing protein n=1 Tax=Paragonimus westermani TaxID=34504 RepID=A0A8T0D681_9TREM|nr:hypothetical protein P879_11926 [Paragonimus westermani]
MRRTLVLTGTGISEDGGIPDFTTPSTGHYENLSQYNLPWPEAVFDLQYFYSDPEPYYSFAKDTRDSFYLLTAVLGCFAHPKPTNLQLPESH